jgi:hypothetical protein
MQEQKTDISAASAVANDFQSMSTEEQRAMEEMYFHIRMQRVAKSRQEHIDFVCKYMGADYQPKFADVLADKSYFAVFYRNKKTVNVSVPPINMSGQVEQLTAGKLYMCSGYEARMLERVLASKRIEVLNVTPDTSGYQIEFAEIMQDWLKPLLDGEVDRRPKPKRAFGNYTEQDDGSTTVKEERADEGFWVNSGYKPGPEDTVQVPTPEPQNGLEADIKAGWAEIQDKDDAEFQQFVQRQTQQMTEVVGVKPVHMSGVEVTELDVEDIEYRVIDPEEQREQQIIANSAATLERAGETPEAALQMAKDGRAAALMEDPLNDEPEDGTEPDGGYTDQIEG